MCKSHRPLCKHSIALLVLVICMWQAIWNIFRGLILGRMCPTVQHRPLDGTDYWLGNEVSWNQKLAEQHYRLSVTHNQSLWLPVGHQRKFALRRQKKEEPTHPKGNMERRLLPYTQNHISLKTQNVSPYCVAVLLYFLIVLWKTANKTL